VRVNTADTEIARVTVKNSWESFSAEVTVSTAYDLQSLFFGTYKSNGSQIYTGGSTTSTYDAFFVADIVVTEVKEFIIPKAFTPGFCEGDQTMLSKPENISVDISKASSGGIEFHNDHVQAVDISLDLNRDTQRLIGYKMNAANPVSLPVRATLDMEMIFHETVTGSFIDNAVPEQKYNLVIKLNDNESNTLAAYTLSGATLTKAASDHNIGGNRSAKMSFVTDTDLESNSKGLFLSGMVNNVCAQVVTNDGTKEVTDDDGNLVIVKSLFYPKY
jgi:hypothetical protein